MRAFRDLFLNKLRKCVNLSLKLPAQQLVSLQSTTEMEQTVMDFSNKQLNIKRRKTRRPLASLEDLPPEILQLILDYCGILDYHKYRLLRCSSLWKPLIDGQYIVLSQKGSKFLLPGADMRSGQSFFNKIEEFKIMLQDFSTRNRIPLSKVKLFAEFEQTDSKHDWYYELFNRIVSYLNELGVTYVIYPRKLARAVQFFPKVTGQNYVLLDLPNIKPLLIHRGANFKVLKIVSELELFAHDEHLYRLLDSATYVFRSTLRHLKTLKTYELERCPLTMVDPIIMKSLEYLEVFELKNKEPLSVSKLSLPKLLFLRFMDCKLLRLSNNDLPLLEDLEIEEYSDRKDIPLEISHNNLSQLKDLSISTGCIKQFFGNKLPCNSDTSANQGKALIDHFRLDTSLEWLIGTVGDIPEIVSKTWSVAIVVRDDPTMTQSILGNIHNASSMGELTLVDRTLLTLDWLSELNFQNLRTFFLYNTDDSLKSLPILKMPKIKKLFILESSINTINIRAYPVLQEIIFLAKRRNTDVKTTRYFHFVGQSFDYYVENGRVEEEVRFKCKDSERKERFRTFITEKTREKGVVKLDSCDSSPF